MAEEKKQGRKIYKKLSNKYRLVIMNDETFEERASLRLSPLNLFVFLGIIIISFITLTIYVIAFTGLREFIPGYTDVSVRKKTVENFNKTDSLSRRIEAQNLFIANLQSILSGDIDKQVMIDTIKSSVLYDSIKFLEKIPEDSLLRKEIENQDKFNLGVGEEANTGSISNFYFFTPLKGTVTTTFDPAQKHFGIDVVAAPDAVIKSALDGTVVFSDWTSQTGYVIAVQHSNNLFSIYKHNSALLKSVGNVIKAGDVLAIIGNTGEFTSGPHLHFELWYNGAPVNPGDYIAF
jgi:murein DD-endopeptidase MepM/ murein hydrolase activator NlpD